ncbi:phytanoyl-CoA dioxygenase family protein [Pedobacter foliorum]|uniref:phytanoyl-CoA dioxygenase family protein n=1 Tax=Pedobacter foliorum TaxID=2739058 RepID=UPI0015651DDC|nr:phytanoyl-CoA dioxygenase family protein [Pedobacter foliorum]NRF39011.1 phytanoyl-CoA dioxygenase family protein [Pedobacter foliorum]
MINLDFYKSQLESSGFTTIDHIFSNEQIERMLKLISQVDTSKGTFRKSIDLFAIRQFLKEVPEIDKLILNDEFKLFIHGLFGSDYFIVKSIYFDKPEQSNWFVSYHQDLTISVDRKVELDDYSKWTVKQNQFSVQPPLDVLKQIYTVRIHLDDTDENNGALKVVPGSHLKDVFRPQDIDWSKETEHICAVPKGGVMIMKPLLLHSSSRTTNNNKRRVIHIEFCNQELHEELKWVERINFL